MITNVATSQNWKIKTLLPSLTFKNYVIYITSKCIHSSCIDSSFIFKNELLVTKFTQNSIKLHVKTIKTIKLLGFLEN
jgi:hypothetical protein